MQITTKEELKAALKADILVGDMDTLILINRRNHEPSAPVVAQLVYVLLSS